MEALIEELEADVTVEESNYENAQECVSVWADAEKEFDGYMASIVGMGLAYESVNADLADYQAKNGGNTFKNIELGRSNYFEKYKVLMGYMFEAISRIHGRS
tara:strand:- start:179 stop:484 length:306 start_codon:yes stop_codon:yes gene_type:complete